MFDFRRFLNNKREGISSFEFAVTLPATILIAMFVFITSIFLIAWCMYSSIASNLAKDLNFRSTGLKTAAAWYNEAEKAPGAGGATGIKFTYNDGKDTHVITEEQVKINGVSSSGGTSISDGNSAYRRAVLYCINNYGNSFGIPYTRLSEDGINVEIRRVVANGATESVTPSPTSENLSNNYIKVSIAYETMGMSFGPNIFGGGGANLPGFKSVASGYSIVT